MLESLETFGPETARRPIIDQDETHTADRAFEDMMEAIRAEPMPTQTEHEYYAAAELKQTLASATASGLDIQKFLGVGFNRAAFLVKTSDGVERVIKIPLRARGNGDNIHEVSQYIEATMNGDGSAFAKTTFGRNRDEWVIQEVCDPAEIDELPGELRSAIYAVIRKYGLIDAQGGYTREGTFKLFDFTV